HYSGKVVRNSQLHLGVYWQGSLEGAIQFGPPMDRRRVLGLVEGTEWNGMLELNRLAFSDRLPRNSESRALGVAFRLFRKHRPDIEWILSYSDATQSGDGTIYRATGFVLTGIKRNTEIYGLPDGSTISGHALSPGGSSATREKLGVDQTAAPGKVLRELGARQLEGFQIRYLYFLNPEARYRLTVPEIPYSEIAARGATMYRGQKAERRAGC
ncbi:MAG: hypothetical protein V3W32_11280, partial [Gemmatimonadota bacterium]